MASQAKKMDPTKTITSDTEMQAVRSESMHDGEVAAIAYEYWLRRGCPIGSPEMDWFQAEEEIQRRGSIHTAA
jgi:hypothetical protein